MESRPIMSSALAVALEGLVQSHEEECSELYPATKLPIVTPPPRTALGRFLGFSDAAYEVQARLRGHILPSYRQWVQGWGDLDNANRMLECFRDVVVPQHDANELLPSVKLTMSSNSYSASIRLFEGEFISPLAEFLPAESRTVRFQVVLPEGQPRAVMVMAQGTADETFMYRRKTVAEPLSRRGVACILPMAPYYGHRRAHGQRLWFLRTFGELVTQVYGSCSEALVLLDWAHKQFPQALLGMSGLSMGAGIAYTVGAVARYDLAVSPLLACHSGSVIASGHLKHELALEALIPSAGPQDMSKEDVRQLVVDTLDAMAAPAVASVVENTWRKLGRKHVNFLCSTDDGLVPPESGIRTFEHARAHVDPEAELHWTPGGHISSCAGARWLFGGVVLRSFKRLARTFCQPDGCASVPSCKHADWLLKLDRSLTNKSAL